MSKREWGGPASPDQPTRRLPTKQGVTSARSGGVAIGPRRRWLVLGLLAIAPAAAAFGEHSIARQWNEQLISAIRRDLARPTVHARNLFHVSIAMWDAWAAYDPISDPFLIQEHATAANIEAARAEAISFASYSVLRHRFATSPGAVTSLASFDAKMTSLGYDKNFISTVGDSPAALGNRIAAAVIAFGLADNSNEVNGYANRHYLPVNQPLVPSLLGNPNLANPNTSNPNRWQSLSLTYFVDQNGNVIPGGFPPALTPEWGQVTPFSLSTDDLTIYRRGNFDWWVYHDPGPPPKTGNGEPGDAYYKWGFEQVAIWSSHLDPSDGVMWDISPGARGNSILPDPGEYESFYDLINGGDTYTGYDVNPVTGKPYEPHIVPRGDFSRVLAEFWADGPSSETPPGHWFSLLNYVSDHPLVQKRFGGSGPILGDLEWDVKSYLAMGGALHDVAIAVWGTKGWYDYIRPISAIRYMTDRGQSSDQLGPSFHPRGIHLYPGLIEVVTPESSAPGERHAHLRGTSGENVGKIALRAWRGPSAIANPATDVAGVGWILAGNWWPYQRPTFVTPPFPGYTSGHSAYSRAGAEVLTLLTGSKYFPGGLGEFHCAQNQYLVFEDGPSVDVTLQWASYYDAADQSALSRIWGGIHPGQDDLPSRKVGAIIGPEAFDFAVSFFKGAHGSCPNGNDSADADADTVADACDECPGTGVGVLVDATGCEPVVAGDFDRDGDIDLPDLAAFQRCFRTIPGPSPCIRFDADGDLGVGVTDFPIILDACRGPDVPAGGP